MSRRTFVAAAAGVVAGAAVVGIPAVAHAEAGSGSGADAGAVECLPGDPASGNRAVAPMGGMMSDPRMRDHMCAMMGSAGGMPGAGGTDCMHGPRGGDAPAGDGGGGHP